MYNLLGFLGHSASVQWLQPAAPARLTHPRADVPFDAVEDAERCVSYLSDKVQNGSWAVGCGPC